MNSNSLIEYIANPDLLDDSNIFALEGLVKEHPYYQIAHVLLLYNLKICNSEKFDQQLRESAIFTPDRRSLYNLLYHNPSDSQIDSNKITDSRFLSEEPIEFQFGDSKSEVTIDEPINTMQVGNEDSNQELLEIDEIVSEQSGTIELNVVSEEVLIEEKEISNTGFGFALIDKFIGENPAFVPNKLSLDEIREDISVPSVQEDDSLVTETLATIFEMQKLYEKAISVYEKLILKNPEKSIYFASRINDLKINIK